MSITRDRGSVVIECDEPRCGNSEMDDSFEELWPQIKELGWRASKDSRGNWTHTCPDCCSDDLSKLTKGLK